MYPCSVPVAVKRAGRADFLRRRAHQVIWERINSRSANQIVTYVRIISQLPIHFQWHSILADTGNADR